MKCKDESYAGCNQQKELQLVSNTDRRTDQEQIQLPEQDPPRAGHSGKGAESAMKQMREWEDGRADDRVPPPSDKLSFP